MAKTSGLGMSVFVDGLDIGNDVQSFNCSGGPAVLEFTGVDKFAYERKGGKRSGMLSAVTYFNPGALNTAVPGETGSHRLLRAMPLTDRIVTAWHNGTTDAASLVAKQGLYDPTLAADGALTIAVDAQSNGYGLEWGTQLTADKVTITGAGAQASVDFTAATAFGAQAYLQVFSFAGTDATVAIQSSSDNGSGDAFSNVTGLGFTAITTTTPQAQRVETTRTLSIERYLRVNVTTSAGFTSLVFAVMVVKNATSTLF